MAVTIVTRRAGTCSVCAGHVAKGEYVLFDREIGTVHPECADRLGEAQPLNSKAGRCSRCGRWLLAREGRLHYAESQRDDGSFKRTWQLTCLNGACG